MSSNRIFASSEESGFDYTVSYRITPESIEQAALDGFPFKKRGDLEPETPPNTVELTSYAEIFNS